MKIRVLLLTTIVLFIFSCLGYANQFTMQECSLGGISMHMKPDQVISIYGEPTEKRGEFDVGKTGYFKYGDTIQIKFVNGDVWAILSTGDNGWKLPSGIAVGDRLKDVTDLYGKVNPEKGSRGITYLWYSEAKGFNGCALEVSVEYSTNLNENSKITSIQVFTGGASAIDKREEF